MLLQLVVLLEVLQSLQRNGTKGYTCRIEKCYNKGIVTKNGPSWEPGGIAGMIVCTDEGNMIFSECYYLESIGVEHGVGGVKYGTEEELEAMRAGTHSTSKNINSFEEFLVWIENPTE